MGGDPITVTPLNGMLGTGHSRLKAKGTEEERESRNVTL